MTLPEYWCPLNTQEGLVGGKKTAQREFGCAECDPAELEGEQVCGAPMLQVEEGAPDV